MSVNERIRLLRDALGKNPTQFAADIGVPRTTLLGWESGKSVPIETAEKIGIAFPQVDMQWLLTGKGIMIPGDSGRGDKMSNSWTLAEEPQRENIPPLPDSSPQSRPLDLSSTGCADDEAGPMFGSRLEGARSIETRLDRQESEVVYIDFFTAATAGAGPGKEVESFQPSTPMEILRSFLAPWRPEQVKAIEVRGDSMTKIGLFDRDIALFVPAQCEGDGVFVISIEGKLQVKRLEFDILGKTLRIISENDRYQPRVLTDLSDIERVIIEGKVVGWLHRHPY